MFTKTGIPQFWRGGKDSVSAKSACALCDSGCKTFDAFFLTYPVSPHNAAVCIATSCCGERGLSENMTALARDIGDARRATAFKNSLDCGKRL